MRLPRAAGILLHPTSLPGRFGIGDLGPEAETFVRFLHESGQRWWQILPTGPTGYGNSPYQSLSSYAGNPLLISPERLVEDGLLTSRDLAGFPNLPADRVDYDTVTIEKNALLHKAFRRFDVKDRAFVSFCRREAGWLLDFALYRALKAAHGERAWIDWEPDIALRVPSAMQRWRRQLREEVRYNQFTQFLFDRQWCRLREFCRSHGVGLIGDVPIFVAFDSADVWTRPELFELDEQGRPTVVAGVPPDYFSKTGQLWGNPLYRWPHHEATGFAWWADRLRAALERVDLVRLDHFRGFEAYWEVPAGSVDARPGRWMPAPGVAFLEAMRRALGGLPLVAEDLGFITPPVHALRDQFELPGMRVLQFAFGNDEEHRPYTYPRNCFVYTGTHDNETTVGWFRSKPASRTENARAIAAERELARNYVGSDGSEIHWDFIRLALSSVADTAIIPLQDLLGLGNVARMNTPGRAAGNWQWRFRRNQISRTVRARLTQMTELYGRWNRYEGARPSPRKRLPSFDHATGQMTQPEHGGRLSQSR